MAEMNMETKMEEMDNAALLADLGMRECVGLRITYTDDFIDWQLGEEHPINPIRAFVLKERMEDLVGAGACVIDTEWNRPSQITRRQWEKSALKSEPHLVEKRKQESAEMWETELTMFGGTYYLTETLIREYYTENKYGAYFNPAGGENNHHDGVAVISDLAWACKRLANSGLRVAYIDWDAHHCSDVETLLDGTGILTASIHSISTVEAELPTTEEHINYEMTSDAQNSDLISAVTSILDTIDERGGVDVLVLNISADGYAPDESTDLGWTEEGYFLSAKAIAEYAGAREISILMGGGGGTLPLEDGTPEIWFIVLGTITAELSQQQLRGVLAKAEEGRSFEHSRDYSDDYNYSTANYDPTRA